MHILYMVRNNTTIILMKDFVLTMTMYVRTCVNSSQLDGIALYIQYIHLAIFI